MAPDPPWRWKSHPRSAARVLASHDRNQGVGMQNPVCPVDQIVKRHDLIFVPHSVSEWVSDALNECFQAFGEGLAGFTTPDVEALTGHAARSIEEFAGDFAAAFAPAGAPA